MIAYLINQYPAVSHSFIRREILALERQGHRILRISVRGYRDVQIEEQDHLEAKQTRYVLGRGLAPLIAAFFQTLLTRPLRLLKTFVLAWQMSRRAERSLPYHLVYLFEACLVASWLRQENVTHLHAHFGTNSAEVAMLVHELGGPDWSFTAHGPEEFDKSMSIGISEKIKRAAFVVAVSSFGRSQLFRNIAHQHWSKIKIVHCGLEKEFHQGQMNYPTFSNRLICVGRLCEQKGQLLLLDAARRLHQAGIQFELVLAGDGEMRSDLETLIEEYQLKNMVRITGWLSSAQIRKEILAARALVLPSFAEGLPVVIMEAMALRRPVISTYVAGIPELVNPGEHGWLVPSGDIDQLVSAMQTCLERPIEELARMGDAARARVLERHDVDKEAAKLYDLMSPGVKAAA